ncbi:MAG: SH3 domain-containing protein [Gammaproteobacteria bacterium]|nr:SH3 domain-containing protein [Gammaproteobacteria bacterium]
MKKIALLLALFVAAPLVHAEDYLYILSARAKLLANPVFGSETLVNMTKGEKVIELEKTNNWFKVKFEGKTGWLSRLSVSPHPPVKRRHRLASVDNKLQNSARRRASNVSTTAAVRGLSELSRARLNSKDTMNFAALENMEKVKVSETEVLAFLDGISE